MVMSSRPNRGEQSGFGPGASSMRFRAQSTLDRRAPVQPAIAAVLFFEELLLRAWAEAHYPFAVHADTLIAVDVELERLAEFLQVVELDGTRLVEGLEISRVDEVGHRDAVHQEKQVLNVNLFC